MDDEVNGDLDSLFDDTVSTTTEEPAKTPPETPTEETPKAPEKTETPAETSSVDKPPETIAEPVSEEKAVVEEQPAKPLTAEEVRAILSEVRTEERNSGRGLEETEQEVLNAYYPQGLSNTLVDEKTGKEIKSPQDVVDLSDGNMSMEEAAQWLTNEQFKLNKNVTEIKQSARELAETNYNFKQGAVRVVGKYQPIFDKYPQLQEKIYRNYMKTVKMDNEKDLVLSAPDIEDYYADVMEPYVMAFSYQGGQQSTPAATPASEGVGEPAKILESKQSASDRMDVTGDAGAGAGDSEADPSNPEDSLNKLFGE